MLGLGGVWHIRLRMLLSTLMLVVDGCFERLDGLFVVRWLLCLVLLLNLVELIMSLLLFLCFNEVISPRSKAFPLLLALDTSMHHLFWLVPIVVIVFLVACTPATTRLHRALSVQGERYTLFSGRLLLLVNMCQMLLGPGLHQITCISRHRGALAGTDMILVDRGYRMLLELVSCWSISCGCLRFEAV